MFKAVKEIIWHITCNCGGWFTYATMEDNLRIDRITFHCPHCGQKNRSEVQETADYKLDANSNLRRQKRHPR